MPRGFFECQIERGTAFGRDPDAVRRYLHAMQFGRCTEAEAYVIIRDRDCAHLGRNFDLFNLSDLPDRWFRNAWYRSPNGGPISIDLNKARGQQWHRIQIATDDENLRRKHADPLADPFTPDWGQLRDRIKAARAEDDLIRVWPKGLPHPKIPQWAVPDRPVAL